LVITRLVCFRPYSKAFSELKLTYAFVTSINTVYGTSIAVLRNQQAVIHYTENR